MIKLEWVQSDEDLHDCWSWVRPRLVKLLEKNPADYLPEDVYHAVKTGGSFLGLFDDDSTGEWVAFIVLTPVKGHDVMQMFVWCFFNESGTDTVVDNWHIITEFCRHYGAKRILAQSSRPGWLRFGAKLGFKQTQINYKLDL